MNFKELAKDCQSFNDFHQNLVLRTNTEKDSIFEDFAKYFFKHDPRYKQFVKEYYKLNEVPTEILEKVNIPTNDIGIDTVAVTYDDKLIAVQVKYRSNINEVITWENLSTFAGTTFGIGNNFHKGIVFTNVREISKHIRNSPRMGLSRLRLKSSTKLIQLKVKTLTIT